MDIVKPYNPNKYKIDGCFLDNKKKFAFIHIYKNASISLRNALGMRKAYFKYRNVKNQNLKTITIIRDPIDRIVSIYLYLLRLKDNGFQEQHPIHITEQTLFYKKRSNTIRSFIYFIDAIEPNNFYDATTYPQTASLADRGLTINDIDEIFIQEDIDNQYQLFKNKYSIKNNKKFPKDNQGNSTKKILLNNYIDTNLKIKLRIKKIYEKDIHMYNEIINKKNV